MTLFTVFGARRRRALAAAGLALLPACSLTMRSRDALTAEAYDCQILGEGQIGRSVFGVAIGDWNEDGHQDLVFGAAETRILTPFLNDGRGAFTAATALSTNPVPRGIGVGDIDEDGHLDLTVGHARSNDVWVFKGDGRGAFAKIGSYWSGDSPFDAPLADFDGDGHLDLLIVNESNASWSGLGTVSVLFGVGNGKFGKPVDLRAGYHPAHATIADFDGRNGPDLAVANWDSATVAVWLNQGDRSFRLAHEMKTGGDLAYSIGNGDFDHDGNIDLVVSDTRNARLYVFRGSGDGQFAAHQTLGTGKGVRCVITVDLDGDSWLDLVSVNVADHTLSLFDGRNGSFTPRATVSVGRLPRLVKSAELNGDGRPDLVVSNQDGASATLLLSVDGHGRTCPSLPAGPAKKVEKES